MRFRQTLDYSLLLVDRYNNMKMPQKFVHDKTSKNKL